jgi:predicted phage gp36 major capsid-like protein
MNKQVEKIKKHLEERLEAVEEARRKYSNPVEKHTWDVLWCEYKTILSMIDKDLKEEKEEECSKTLL